MKRRCYDPWHRSYHRYGGRGIFICGEWLCDFHSFRDWAITSGFDPALQLDRIDNNGPYSPENCRFVTHRVNCLNRPKREAKPPKERSTSGFGRLGKPVVRVEDGTVYSSASEASRQLGLHISAVGHAISGYRSRAGGYHWRFA